MTGMTEKLFMCQMFMCLFWPLFFSGPKFLLRVDALHCMESKCSPKTQLQRKKFPQTVCTPTGPKHISGQKNRAIQVQVAYGVRKDYIAL